MSSAVRILMANRVHLPVTEAPAAEQRADKMQIDANWAAELSANPTLFDGHTHFARGFSCDAGVFSTISHPGRYAAQLYWRKAGYPGELRLIFGDTIFRTTDGALLLGQMASHTANPGRVYFPGGLMDERDVVSGHLDADGNIVRELTEETGLTDADVRYGKDYIIAITNSQIAVGKFGDLPWPGKEARDRVFQSALRRGDGELEDMHVIHSAADGAALDMPDYARALVDWYFAGGARTS